MPKTGLGLSAEQKPARLMRSLRLWSVIILGLGYLTPMTVFDTFGIVSDLTDFHVASAYIVALVAILFTAASYGKMVKAFPISGSAYTYTKKAINPHVGFMVGWVSILDYLFLPMINVLLGKIYLNAAFPEVPDWIWVIFCTLLITLANIRSIKIAANFTSLLVAFQVLVTVIFVILAIKGITQDNMGTGTLATLEPFISPGLNISTLLAGSAVLCFSYLGFDAVTTYTEETYDATTTIPRAIYLVAIIGGGLFIMAAFFGTLAFPNLANFESPDTPSPEMAYFLGGSLFKAIFLAGAIVGTFASGMPSQASATRLLYVMGRENVIPKKIFGKLSLRYRTPVINSLLVGAFCLSAMYFSLDLALSFINFGALTAFTAVNIAVVWHYVIRNKKRSPKDLLVYLLFPLLGATFIGYLWSNLNKDALTVGTIWTVLGLIYLAIRTSAFTKKAPEVQFDEAV